ncbi:fasciclin domain-containing protein [Streptomyces sp. NPDC059142]|uniref:fasciclin domain-containing protein n=1 Tax=unclassified Streptomyces TaxID=2593676 RepID=UPI0036AC0D6E
MYRKRSHLAVLATAVTAAVLPLSAALSAPGAVADTPSPSPSVSSSVPSGDKPFGPGCSKLPQSGSGSVKEMASQELATAVSNNPELSTLADALKKAGLTDSLNKDQDITVFAPTNTAFNSLGKEQLTKLLANTGALKKQLTYHVVDKKITPDQLSHGTFTTKEGSTLTTSGSGTSFKVNDTASITCGNIKTTNGTIYVIDGVLTPPH